MIKIIFKEHSGSVHEVTGTEGESLMDVAMNNMIPGIDGDCGGDCACGTCHVIVAADWTNKLQQSNGEEDALIGMTPDKKDGSRLACQVALSGDMDGMEVTLPEFQM